MRNYFMRDQINIDFKDENKFLCYAKRFFFVVVGV